MSDSINIRVTCLEELSGLELLNFIYYASEYVTFYESIKVPNPFKEVIVNIDNEFAQYFYNTLDAIEKFYNGQVFTTKIIK